jgi:hypothetical protein
VVLGEAALAGHVDHQGHLSTFHTRLVSIFRNRG